MTRRRTSLIQSIIAAAGLCLAASATAAPPLATAPSTVSPGETVRVAPVGDGCPTFSWSLVSGAASYELVVWEVSARGELAGDGAHSSLEQTLPGSVTSWTPSLDRCLMPGGRYAWLVRAQLGEKKVSPWSEARLFEVASRLELEEALAVVRSYLAAGGNPAALAGPSAAERTPVSAETRTAVTGSGAVLNVANLSTAEAAIVGEPARAEGDVAGVLGVTRSPDGAGVVAANAVEEGGADLVLDGSAQGLGDTVLTESGIVVGQETFAIGTSGDTLTLLIDGVAAVTTATDADTLAQIPGCTDEEIPRWDASAATWKCTADEDTTYTNGNQLSLAGATFNVLEGSGSGLDADTLDAMDATAFAAAAHEHGGADIQDGSLTGADVQDGSLTAADLADVRAGIYTTQLSGMFTHCALLSDATIACWGWDFYNQLLSPPGRFTQISIWNAHGCGVASDGSVECWGTDTDGQLTPPAGSFVQVSAGGYHSCGVKTDSSLACWGRESSGELSPPGGSFSQVADGWGYSCGLLTGGQIVCWGAAGVLSPPSGTFTAIDAGWFHACGIRSDQSVACWGLNDDGRSTPPAGSFLQVSAGREHSCGVREGGDIACWGLNSNGETLPPAGSFQQVEAADYYTCGLKNDGGVVCWGRDFDGSTLPPLALR